VTNLDLQLYRRVVLNAAAPGAGKTTSIVYLAQELEEYGKKIMVIDRDRGFADSLREISDGKFPSNLDYRFIRTWDDVDNAVAEALDEYGDDDWFVAEHAGRIWEFAREQYVQRMYGKSHAKLLNDAREEAEAEIKKKGLDLQSKEADAVRRQHLGYGGLDGRLDWVPIKSQHNNDLFEKLIFDGRFNILTTTTWNPLDAQSADSWPEWKKWGRRPQGEKEQVARHSTVVGTYKRDGEFMWRTDFGDASKDRGREHVKDIPFTGRSWISSYVEFHGEELVGN
jgi:hypothetical protein